MNREGTRWERWVFEFFMRRGPVVAAAAPLLVGFLILAGVTIIASSVSEGRLLPRNGETVAVLVAAEAALVSTYLVAFWAMAAVVTKGRYQRLLNLHQTMREIRAMSWTEFEQLVAANYQAQGYSVEHVGRSAPDGGRDLILKRDGTSLLVQCKHYRSSWVYERPLREFLGVIDDARADGGLFVCCGVFDERAIAYAKNNPRLRLIAGEELREMIARSVERRLAGRTYACPSCGAPMQPKNGRRGLFLSCTLFPTCRGSMDWPAVA